MKRTRTASVGALLRTGLLLTAAAALIAALLPLDVASAQSKPTEANCPPNFGESIEGYLSHDDLRRAVDRLDSNRNIDVEVAGHSNQGREIWSARVGEGDTVLLIQGGIHGLEQHGTKASINLLQTLGNESRRSQEIRDALTIVVIPDMNPDGSAVPRRQNVMPWSDVMDLHGFDDQPRAWYYSGFAQGFDVNRDFNPDLDYEPDQSDLPGTSTSVGFYLTPEAQTTRDVYRALEEEFGRVDVFVDLHNQGGCHEVPDEDRYSDLSISGRFIADPAVHGDWPHFDDDASRRANVAIYDALQQRGDSRFGTLTLYPQPPGLDLPGTALGSFALRGSAVVLFETSQGTNQNAMGMLVKQIEVGLTGLIDALVDDTFGAIDPDRYDEIPVR